ncbi:hypothetical protein [Geodermatophilus nigrescens]|uniref:PASTA domain-containing protein n=1 Tax=Geodermatophilus nigrescens TaxID=1070870 RepID=A0A1M5JNA3_9ACTN|nr:hypothetical protein [Geodermatophilus nigrescens]SHG41729.1 hypothetical protein SAMN05444351_2567 [Geodermatophilus nigrescens]
MNQSSARRRLGALPVLLATGLLLAGCGDDGETGLPAPTSTPSAPATSSAAAPTTPAPTTPAPEPAVAPAPTPEVTPAPVVVDFLMPAVVGMTLQDAQDLIQTNGVFLSLSHDLLGSRNQVLDANRRVCTQNIAPGQRVTGDVDGAIDLGAVKLDELCP